MSVCDVLVRQSSQRSTDHSNPPLWRGSSLRWPLRSASLLGECISRRSPALWATSFEISLRRLLGSVAPIFTWEKKKKKTRILHSATSTASVVLVKCCKENKSCKGRCMVHKCYSHPPSPLSCPHWLNRGSSHYFLKYFYETHKKILDPFFFFDGFSHCEPKFLFTEN